MTALAGVGPVLIVDGDPDQRLLLEMALCRRGAARILTADSLATARGVLDACRPAAVVLDACLPDGDGIELLGELVERDAGPAILLGSVDSSALAVEAMRAGAADYLVRSERLADLLPDVVERAVERAAVATSARTQRARIDALVDLVELKNGFISRVSHELRTPLTYVLGYAELLANRDFEPEQTREFAAEIAREARHLAGLLDSLLGSAESSRMTDPPKKEPVDVLALAVEVWLDQEGHQGRELVTRASPGLCVLAEPELLRQVLRALIENAIRYSPEGSHIDVEAEPFDDGVQVAVVDRGIGFEPTLAERLFEPLYRVERDETHSVRGLGLGLGHARSIAAAHGGRLTAHSEGRGRGARFELWLPGRV